MKINTLYELLRHGVEKFASRTAFDMFNGESVTYAEVGRRAAAVQEALVGAGVKAGDKVDIAFTPQINEFRLRRSVQLQITAMRLHDPKPLCGMILEDELPVTEASSYCPDRSAFVKAWRRLQALGGSVAADLDGVIRQCPHGIEPERFCICLMVLCELGLLKTVKPGSVFGAKMVSGSAKVNLESSELIKRLKARRS